MKYGQEQASLEPVVKTYHRYRNVLTQVDEAREMLAENLDDEMKAMVKEEIDTLTSEQQTLEQKLRVMLLPVTIRTSSSKFALALAATRPASLPPIFSVSTIVTPSARGGKLGP